MTPCVASSSRGCAGVRHQGSDTTSSWAPSCFPIRLFIPVVLLLLDLAGTGSGRVGTSLDLCIVYTVVQYRILLDLDLVATVYTVDRSRSSYYR